MLTWRRVYFEEAQEKLKNKLLLFKKSPPLVLVWTVDPNIPTLPLTLAQEQLLYTPHGQQRLWEHKHTYAHVKTQTHSDGLRENKNFTTWSWHLLEMWHLRDLNYSLCWPNLSWDQVTIPTPHCGFLHIEWICYWNEFEIFLNLRSKPSHLRSN